MSRLPRDGTAEPVSRDQILRHARGQGNVHSPCSADHEQDWQPYPVDPYSAVCDDHTYICRHRMTRMTGPDCVVRCNLINTYIHAGLRGYVQFNKYIHTYIHTYIYSKRKDQPGKVANPARGQLNTENEYFPVPVRA